MPARLCWTWGVDLISSDLDSAGAQDLILGTVEHYDFYEIRPFLRSLRATSSSAHVCLFAGPGISRRTIRKIRQYDIEVQSYGGTFPFVASPHADTPKSLPQPIHIYNYRHFLYYDYLLKHGRKFRNVLITDVRDVVFQANPFEFPISDRIQVAMENPRIPIGACPWTSEWLLAGYPREVLERLKDGDLSCAGTTLAPVTRIMRYLKLMLAEIGRMKDAYTCADQAAHNVLLHDGKLDPVEKLPNFEGPILTVGSEPGYKLDANDHLVNRDGSMIALVHQYDRHPDLVRIVEKRNEPRAWKRSASKALFGFKRRMRSLRKRIRPRAAGQP